MDFSFYGGTKIPAFCGKQNPGACEVNLSQAPGSFQVYRADTSVFAVYES